MKSIINKGKYFLLQLTLTIVILLTSILISDIVISKYEQQQISELREGVSERSISIQSQLSNEINASLNLVLGLVGFINVVQTPSQQEFELLAEVIIQKSDIIRNLGLAPGNVISYMYPIEGNEEAIGLDYMKIPLQKDVVLRAIETGKEVIVGPVDLVQGGEGLIARIPIFTGKKLEDYWGMASIVVDKEKLFSKINIKSSDDWLNIAIKGKDGKGLEGGMVYGDEQVFYNNPVLTNIILPDGHWVIAAEPAGGWNSGKRNWSYGIFWFILSLAFIISLLIMNVISTNRKMHILALYDPLTKIANRRLFQMLAEQQIGLSYRNKTVFYLIYFDLDNFKKINDNYGHKAGDSVLQKVAESILDNIRDSDIFARMGGDEFVLLPGQIDNQHDLNILCSKILHVVSDITDELDLKVRIGCSIGISCYPVDGEIIEELIKKADDAMYQSKKDGKNRISYYSGLNPEENILSRNGELNPRPAHYE